MKIGQETCTFNEGDEYPDLISFVCETVGMGDYVEEDPLDPLSGVLILKKKFKVTIEIFDDLCEGDYDTSTSRD